MNDDSNNATALRPRAAAGYTAGPWAVEPVMGDDDLSIICDYHVPGDGYPAILGHASTPLEQDPDRPPSWDQARANARLIADAPTMIELLAALVASWSEDAPDPSTHALRMEDARALVTKHCREAA